MFRIKKKFLKVFQKYALSHSENSMLKKEFGESDSVYSLNIEN